MKEQPISNLFDIAVVKRIIHQPECHILPGSRVGTTIFSSMPFMQGSLH